MNTTTRSPPLRRATVRPCVDVLETPEALLLIADVPGADEESIELTLVDDVLTLRATTASVLPDGWEPADAAPGLPGAYERAFRLATDIERDSIQATLENGRLRVVLQKRRPVTHRIAVRTG